MDFYHRQSAVTEPGPYQSMFDGLPADATALSEIVRGVFVHRISGMREVQGNVVRHLAALNRVETLPWDAWGLIPRHYDTLTEPEKDRLDHAARLSADAGPPHELQTLYEADADLRMPGSV